MKRIYLLPLPLVLAAALTGCHQGFNAATTVQDETGNGIELQAGDLQIEAVTIVAGEAGRAGSVTAVIVNNGTEADELRSITVEGKPADISPANAELAAQSSVSVRTGGDVTADVPLGQAVAGEFVEVTFVFANNGEATDDVLIVPPTGYYSSAAPAAPGSATESPAPTATPSPTASATEESEG